MHALVSWTTMLLRQPAAVRRVSRCAAAQHQAVPGHAHSDYALSAQTLTSTFENARNGDFGHRGIKLERECTFLFFTISHK